MPLSPRILMATMIALACTLLLFPALATSRELSSAVEPSAANNNPIKGLADHFVEIHGGEFVVDCQVWKPVGFNQWEVMESGAAVPYLLGASLPPNTPAPALLRSVMDRAVADGLSFMRAWGHGVHNETELQVSPGVYREGMFVGLDYALAEARARGLKVIIPFGTHWLPVGGVPQYARWAGLSSSSAFYSDPTARQLYKDHVRTVLERVNAINGIAYKDDPTIFAWNVVNEPRCQGCPPDAIASFSHEVAAFIKSIDAKHLVTVGEEGFYSRGPGLAANPQAGSATWPAEQGQDFVVDHDSPDIDFMSFHLWVDNWDDRRPAFIRRWIDQHAADGAALGKPVLLQEFGSFASQREAIYTAVLDAVAAAVEGGSALKGAGMWQLFMPGQVGPLSEGGAGGKYGVYPSDAAWKRMSAFAARLNRLFGSARTCTEPANAPVPAPAPCPRGFEGAACQTDINECARGTDTCPDNAACTNTVGGYTCACWPGYALRGASCERDVAAIQRLTAGYVYEPGKINCKGGDVVPWPPTAPGFAYDPAGVIAKRNNTLPSCAVTNVTVEECKLACSIAPGCTGFTANQVASKCCLTGGGNYCAADNTCNADRVTCESANDLGQTFSFDCGAWESYYAPTAACGAVVSAAGAAGVSSRVAG